MYTYIHIPDTPCDDDLYIYRIRPCDDDLYIYTGYALAMMIYIYIYTGYALAMMIYTYIPDTPCPCDDDLSIYIYIYIYTGYALAMMMMLITRYHEAAGQPRPRRGGRSTRNR